MLKVQELKELIRALDQSSIDEFKYESNGVKVKIKKNRAEATQVVEQQVEQEQAKPVIEKKAVVEVQKQEAPTQAEKEPVAEKAENVHTITSPMVGTFYVAPSPDSPSYVNVGDAVNESSIVCIVEAMKLMNEIEAEVNGKIIEVLAENGELVEYGQPLFIVERN